MKLAFTLLFVVGSSLAILPETCYDGGLGSVRPSPVSYPFSASGIATQSAGTSCDSKGCWPTPLCITPIRLQADWVANVSTLGAVAEPTMWLLNSSAQQTGTTINDLAKSGETPPATMMRKVGAGRLQLQQYLFGLSQVSSFMPWEFADGYYHWAIAMTMWPPQSSPASMPGLAQKATYRYTAGTAKEGTCNDDGVGYAYGGYALFYNLTLMPHCQNQFAASGGYNCLENTFDLAVQQAANPSTGQLMPGAPPFEVYLVYASGARYKLDLPPQASGAWHNFTIKTKCQGTDPLSGFEWPATELYLVFPFKSSGTALPQMWEGFSDPGAAWPFPVVYPSGPFDQPEAYYNVVVKIRAGPNVGLIVGLSLGALAIAATLGYYWKWGKKTNPLSSQGGTEVTEVTVGQG